MQLPLYLSEIFRTPCILTILVLTFEQAQFTTMYQLMCPKTAGSEGNSVDPDQMMQSSESHLVLHCLHRLVCLKLRVNMVLSLFFYQCIKTAYNFTVFRHFYFYHTIYFWKLNKSFCPQTRPVARQDSSLELALVYQILKPLTQNFNIKFLNLWPWLLGHEQGGR